MSTSRAIGEPRDRCVDVDKGVEMSRLARSRRYELGGERAEGSKSGLCGEVGLYQPRGIELFWLKPFDKEDLPIASNLFD